MESIDISEYDYPLTEERIAKFPLGERDASRLLVYREGEISDGNFPDVAEMIPAGSLMVCNNTRVVRARIMFFKESGARIEVFCLEPHSPADYERAFSVRGRCRWNCIIGNLKKWKGGALRIPLGDGRGELAATLAESSEGNHIVEFSWEWDRSFGEILEMLGHIPIPPYLNREDQEIDNSRYQTVYSKLEGSVAAPTAGLHFTERVFGEIAAKGIERREITLHVGAGTFLPVKGDDAAAHAMHTEYFEVDAALLRSLIEHKEKIVAVGTTSVRTLESLPVLGYRVLTSGDAGEDSPIGQWEAYAIPERYSGRDLIERLLDYMEARGIEKIKSSTRIMITPAGFRFRVVNMLITNFHQPKSTLLLLVSAFIGGDWRRVYSHALESGYRFLSYGDSSILIPRRQG